MRFPARVALLGVSVATVCGTTIALSVGATQWWQPTDIRGAVKLATPVTLVTPATLVKPGQLPIHKTGYAGRYRDGVATGQAFDAYYGIVQVQAVIREGRVIAIRVLRHPSHYATSRYINGRALPRLEREVITAQSARVHAVSGATLTSDAFIRSVGDALRRAGG